MGMGVAGIIIDSEPADHSLLSSSTSKKILSGQPISFHHSLALHLDEISSRRRPSVNRHAMG